MPDDDQGWTCKHILEKDCWRHLKSKLCPYPTLAEMRSCKEFKEKMKW